MRRVGTGLIGVLIALGATPSGAGEGVLDHPGRTLGWFGPHFEAAAGGDPVACDPASCHTYEAAVALPVRALERASLEVAIRWPSEYDDFDLHVYRPDALEVPARRNRVGSAEVAHDRRPIPGTYRVVVTARRVTDSGYEGAVQLEPRARIPGPPRSLLPNLRTLPPRDFHIATATHSFFGDPTPSRQRSCYEDETAETGASRCLRFDNVVANAGRGDLAMRFLLSGVGSDQRMQQVVARTRGGPRYREAGAYSWHESHGHVHYEGFAGYRLFAVDAAGRLTAATENLKSGFCLQDTELRAWRRRGNGPTIYTYPGCEEATEQDSSGTWGAMGITRGWADVYTWDLPDQYVPIDGLPDGSYVLETVADASGLVRETREDDNAAWALLRITGNEVELLGSGRGPARHVPT